MNLRLDETPSGIVILTGWTSADPTPESITWTRGPLVKTLRSLGLQIKKRPEWVYIVEDTRRIGEVE